MTKQMSPLRQRMIEDMTIRNRSLSTQKIYVAAVANFSIFHGRSPDKLSFEDVRDYRLHLLSRGLKPNTVNPIMGALRFFYGTTLGRKEASEQIPYARREDTLPAVLARDEVVRFLKAPPHFGCGGRARPRVPSETGNDHKNLLHACRRHLCPDRASAVDPDCDGVVRHLEWRRCAVLGELDCRHRGGRVELRRLPRRHAQLKAGRARPGRSVAGQRSHFPIRGHRAVVLYRDSGLVHYVVRPQYFAT